MSHNDYNFDYYKIKFSWQKLLLTSKCSCKLHKSSGSIQNDRTVRVSQNSHSSSPIKSLFLNDEWWIVTLCCLDCSIVFINRFIAHLDSIREQMWLVKRVIEAKKNTFLFSFVLQFPDNKKINTLSNMPWFHDPQVLIGRSSFQKFIILTPLVAFA